MQAKYMKVNKKNVWSRVMRFQPS